MLSRWEEINLALLALCVNCINIYPYPQQKTLLGVTLEKREGKCNFIHIILF